MLRDKELCSLLTKFVAHFWAVLNEYFTISVLIKKEKVKMSVVSPQVVVSVAERWQLYKSPEWAGVCKVGHGPPG